MLDEKSNKLFSPKFEEYLHKKAKLKQSQKSYLAKSVTTNMTTISPFHQALHLMPEVGDDLSHSSGVPPATPPQREVATRKVMTNERHWETIYLNNSWSLMKNQPTIHFYELITSLHYLNPVIKKFFPHHLKNTPLACRITNFVSNWSKLTNDKEIFRIVKGLKIQFLESPIQNLWQKQECLWRRKY